MLFRKPEIEFIPVDFSENIIATSLTEDDTEGLVECLDGVTGWYSSESGITDPSEYENDEPYVPEDGVLYDPDPDDDILES